MKTLVFLVFPFCCLALFAASCTVGFKETNNSETTTYSLDDLTPACVINELTALSNAKNKCQVKLNIAAKKYNEARKQVNQWNLAIGLIGAGGGVATGSSQLADTLEKDKDLSAYTIAFGAVTGIAVPAMILSRELVTIDEETASRLARWEMINSSIHDADLLVQKLQPVFKSCEESTSQQLNAMTLILKSFCE